MHLAALCRQNLYVGTYFAAPVGVVGGGPPSLNLLKAASNISTNWTFWLTVGYGSHGYEE